MNKERRDIVVQPIITPVVYYSMQSSYHEQQVSYCLITAEMGKKGPVAIIWHIYTLPEYRRKGYATDLVNSLKRHYTEIETEGLVPESTDMLLKCGFALRPAMFKSEKKRLVWSRK